ncbi:MAG: Type IIA topoisomerase A subunit GyrA [Candidatus Methanohalarchaeum thermophilum]|uniref:DNA gyrase subunit A n=1 Tax=Methanohalarchaeum thermophilum TaxID=1903181 RepID=A0A1Q6DUC6_METT1|nr:MAG: Type IIA topoisomerase A subunit GyrA [Candidatus Methanohalarchaeum thermophilum]
MQKAREVKDVQLKEKLKDSYLNYSMSVIVGRALPDVRDGLKPVQRRILYAMDKMGLRSSGPYKKSARVVGDVLGKYHPHGDTAIYDALVRMAQGFSLRYPLVDGQGNFGSIDGDSPAAMRYTEAKLTPIAEEMLEDLDKETVEFRDNFDGSLKEPKVLPAKVPNLLINGSSGIAVGMATNIPPHNLEEVIKATIRLIENPNATVYDLMEDIKGPDFPTGGEILGRQGIKEAYETGRGKLKVRGKAKIAEKDKKEKIIIKEIPFQVKKSKIVEQIADLVKDDVITGISDLRDESDREGMRIVVELKTQANSEIVLNKIFSKTNLETTFGVSNLSIVDGEPRVLSLKETIKNFISHRVDVVKNRTQYLLEKAKNRLHVLEGLLVALKDIDKVIELIEESEDKNKAQDKLEDTFDLSEKQADSILKMRLQRLTNLERKKIKDEHQEVKQEIKEYEEILSSRENILSEIKKELLDLKEEYKDKRKTTIAEGKGEIDEIDLIPDEEMNIFLTEGGYIKRTPADEFRKQNRGGTGLIGIDLKENDRVIEAINATNHDNLLCFSNKGNVYWLKTYQLPKYGRRSRGRPIVNLIDGMEEDEKIISIIQVEDLDEEKDLLFLTKRGLIKRTELNEYSNPISTGVIAINLRDNDELIDVKELEDKKIIVASKEGKLVKFNKSEVRPTGRNTKGVKCMVLGDKDEARSLETPKDEEFILIATENGYGKLTKLNEYRTSHRKVKGVITIKTDKKNGDLIDVVTKDREGLTTVTTEEGKIIKISNKDISIQSRNTRGVKLISLKEGDKITSII